MKMKLLIIVLSFLSYSVISAHSDSSITENNTAFYEGVSTNYIIPPPNGFIMNTEDASKDGYSFTFTHKDSSYNNAPVVIGINIFSIKNELKTEFKLEFLIDEDTVALRKHYGNTVNIEEIIPSVTGTNDSLRTIYINDTTKFIPNVMTSYYFSGNEIVIIELTISYTFPRFIAEEIYIDFIKEIRILLKGKFEIG